MEHPPNLDPDRGRPADPASSLLNRKTSPGTVVAYVAAALLALWLIIFAFDRVERRIKWGPKLNRTVLPDWKISLPEAPGLYAVDHGSTIPLQPSGSAPDFSPAVEFLVAGQVPGVGWDTPTIYRYPLESAGLAIELKKSGGSGIEGLIHAAGTGTAGTDPRFEPLAATAGTIRCLSAPVTRRREIIRFLPGNELAPGLYRTENGAFFFVLRPLLQAKYVSDAFGLVEHQRWQDAMDAARIALELGSADEKLRVLVAALPERALKDAQDALAQSKWREAEEKAQFAAHYAEIDSETETGATEVIRHACFDETEEGVILDRAWGLMWTRNVWPKPALKDLTRQLGILASSLDTGGYKDWRTPTFAELSGLYDRLSFSAEGRDHRPSPFQWSDLPGGYFWSIEGQAFSFEKGEKAETPPRVASLRAVRAVKQNPEARIGGIPVLMAAVASAHLGWARALLEAGADPNTKWQDLPVLNQACGDHDVEMVRLLLEKGASPNTIRGVPEIIWAVREEQNEILEALLVAGRDVNARDPDGRTALIVTAAAKGSQPEKMLIAAKLLLAHGADPNLTDRSKSKASAYTISYAAKSELRTLLANAERGILPPKDQEKAAVATGAAAQSPTESPAPQQATAASPVSTDGAMEAQVRPLPMAPSEPAVAPPPPAEPPLTRAPTEKNPEPKPSASTGMTEAAKAKLKNELALARRDAEAARRAVEGLQTEGREAAKQQLLKAGDALMKSSRDNEAAGNLESAVFYARRAESRHRDTEKMLRGKTPR